MSPAPLYLSTPNKSIQRRGVKREVRQKISTVSKVTILAFVASIVGGGRFAVGGGTRRAVASGILERIIGPSLTRIGGALPSNTRAISLGAFVSAAPLTPSFARSSSSFMESSATKPSSVTNNEEMMTSDSCNDDKQHNNQRSLRVHSDDSTFWVYHVESTTSTMDEAKSIVENKFADDNGSTQSEPKLFLLSATSQSKGRGTTQRNWKSSQQGNALFTIGIPQSSWMNDLKNKNDGAMVPLTLLPLKVGSVVAFHIQKALEECPSKSGKVLPRVTVKWPNDVLLRAEEDVVGRSSSSSKKVSHDKIAGILIESARDWFLIGIGINIAWAPDIPSEGVDYGRKAACLSQYCNAEGEANNDDEEYWIDVSKRIAVDIAHDLHTWLHSSMHSSSSSFSSLNVHSGESILNQWKSYVDWDMELIMRDTPKRERVTLRAVMEDGRVVVREVETGVTRTLVADYFL